MTDISHIAQLLEGGLIS